MQPVSRTAEIKEHRVKSLKFGGSVITKRLYIDIKQDLKKKKKKKLKIVYGRLHD